MSINKIPFVVASPEAESTAALFRQAISSFLNPAGGTVAEKGLTVKAKATPNMEVEVEGGDPNGQIWIPGTSLSNQGMYFCSVDSTTGVAIGAASTSNPRVDTIVARVKDSFYAGSQNEFLLEVIAGTPKAGISKPPKTRAEAEADGAGALPASSYVLAYILVPQNASTITSGDIENVAKRATSGPPPANESITESEIGKEAVSESRIAKEAVTDAKVAKGRMLIGSESKYEAEVEVEVQNPSKIVKIKPSATRPSILFAHSITAGPIILEVEGVVTGWAGGEKKGTAMAWIEPGKEALITCEPAAKNTCVYTLIVL